MTRLSFYRDGMNRPATKIIEGSSNVSLDRLRKNLDRLRKTRKQVEEEDGVKIWFADPPYDEPDHLAWLEELDMEESEVLKDDNY